MIGKSKEPIFQKPRKEKQNPTHKNPIIIIIIIIITLMIRLELQN